MNVLSNLGIVKDKKSKREIQDKDTQLKRQSEQMDILVKAMESMGQQNNAIVKEKDSELAKAQQLIGHLLRRIDATKKEQEAELAEADQQITELRLRIEDLANEKNATIRAKDETQQQFEQKEAELERQGTELVQAKQMISELKKDKENLVKTQVDLLQKLDKALPEKPAAKPRTLDLKAKGDGWYSDLFEIEDDKGVKRKCQLTLNRWGDLRLWNYSDNTVIVDANFHSLDKHCTLDAYRIEAGGSTAMVLMSAAEFQKISSCKECIKVRAQMAIHAD